MNRSAGVVLSAVAAAVAFLARPAPAEAAPAVTLVLDATQASRGIMYAHERIPASAGPLTLVYPKWIPGEHGPTGPLNDLAALRITAGGNPLEWRRDQVDLYAFHLDVPPGVQSLNVDFDVLLNAPNDVMSSHSLAIVNWNRVLLYRDGINSRDYFVKPSIVLPENWDYACALRDASKTGNRIDFGTTSLEMLVDSPLDLGRYVKKWDLWRAGAAFVRLDAFADNPQDLDISESLLHAYQRVPGQAFAMYGSRHFIDYHALLALSDDIGFDGIEHHQSSDNRASDDFLTEPSEQLASGDLVTHEFSHSWNGKYRRPEDLTTPNFQVPMQTDLLWVYEGMNQYLGDLLSFRAGIRQPKQYPEYLATLYADLDLEAGRTTTPLIDLTTGAPYYYNARGDYGSIRRTSDDFYTEGELVWLDVDTILRARSHNERSLDTFLHRFTEPSTTGPMVVTYTRAQIESLLSGVEPYDWHAFFQKYVYEPAPHPPSDELERAGWKLVYTPEENEFIVANQQSDRRVIGWYSYGANISDKGDVVDVRPDSPAWKAGLAPGMTVLAVNGQEATDRGEHFSSDVLDYALKNAQRSSTPISLIVKQTGWYQTLSLDYHEGIRYPHLARVEGTPDMLAAIAAPR